MRLFLAIEPDRPAQGQIARLLLEVQRALGDGAAALRWTPATNVHATLHFLGELDAKRAARLLEALGDTLDESPFEIVVDTIGLLPPTGTPRILWAGINAGQAVLESLCVQLGVRVRSAGVPTETRAFLPHLTLARVRERERQRARSLRAGLSAVVVPEIRWAADHVTLFQSDLSGPVPKYEAIHEMRLAGVSR